jgi:hypothetical protein
VRPDLNNLSLFVVDGQLFMESVIQHHLQIASALAVDSKPA